MIKRITERFTPKQYLGELILGLTVLFGLYLIVAWSSYTPLDNSWSTASFQRETINKAGAFGAWVMDAFFVFFGYVGNVLPFLIFFVPAFLLKTKAVRYFSVTKIALRSFGFISLLIGLTMMATLLLSNTNYYLSGGVLGGSLVLSLYPTLGKFGCIITGLALTIIGFIFCSGASLIHFLVRFYNWLTMKNDNSQDVEQSEESVEELEQIVIQKPDSLMVNAENSATKSLDKNEEVDLAENSGKETKSPLIQPETLINISGLPPSVVISSETQKTTEEFNEKLEPFKTETLDELPKVSISAYGDTPSQTMAPNWECASQQRHSIEDQSAVDFSSISTLNEQAMPTVTLATSVENSSSKSTALSGEVDDENDDLARQFAAQEQQRLAEMEARAKALNAEDALKVILNEPPSAVQTPQQEQEKETAPVYKPYGDSLIHPAFQQPTTKREKPSTPLPSLDLLEYRPTQAQDITREEIHETSQRIEQQLSNFGVKAIVKDVLVGPVVTRYELELQPGVKASKVTNIDTDLARALMFRSIRVAEVIPGKPYIGIETPNAHRQIVPLRDVLDSSEFRDSKALLPMALGKDISGKPVVVDLAKMPHLLVAGSTGSGKSVGVNTMILSLLFRVQPEEVKFIMIDPKVVELSVYNDIPHLLTPVVTDMKKAANALRWCVDEMERRYQLLSALRVRNIEGFNEKIDEYEKMGMPIPNPIWKPGDTMDQMPPALQKLSYIVVIVDEFADLMMVAGKQIEEFIARLAQKARAIGIHLILATQRPSVDVITGLIKANVPSRIAFTVASKIDSRTILDQGGAEALLGRGDMLYYGQGSSDLIRVHGAFMSDDEVVRIADDWRARGKPDYIDSILESADEEEGVEKSAGSSGELDPLFDEVMEFVLTTGTTSVSALQRKFSVGFNRAARIMDQMEEQGVVSPMQNGKREILARRPDY
ncbi:DNA translocase FtsK [Rodentibacter trehalosifermentans]|uniref:DNA translocase FtsK n=1 Tax=Rodentibacter trehalosifermentans TaxID=1908263 RepID=A0A1V3IY40_9PAST|nr:DNA translocase FtsK [Rodentibacter trehalosifermentans]OOF47138.1 cell division protein FtsK [Rodentibacter trehalosifermentans]OOF47282.1 cell division protein FtsK [Rodentibacter trehalosifermentans]OOF49079.1 cell division protein FtsK [Rodentibacter trehalosifermentans]